MKQIIFFKKKEGETPLESILRFKKKFPDYKDTPMTYAGRLDPMASGLLIFLAGKKIKEKEKYLSLDKEYLFEVAFGVETDTYDTLGKVLKTRVVSLSLFDFRKKIDEIIKKFPKEILMEYPMFSSKTVDGVPLFAYARENKKVVIPKKKIFIKRFTLEGIRKISGDFFLKNVFRRVEKVKGDFRQKEILEKWDESLAPLRDEYFFIARFKIKVSSGAYVRKIADSLGEISGFGAIAFSIERTKIGIYAI